MRVLCVIDDLGSGGAQRQLVNLGRGLARRGHAVEFFTYYPSAHFRPALEAAGVPVHLREKTARFAVAPVLALRQVVRAGRFESVLAFLETPAVYAELGCLGLRGVRLVVGERNSVPGGVVSVGRALKSQLHRLADRVVANSFAHRDWLAARFPYLGSRLSAIWNGIDLEEFRPSGARPAGPGLRLLGVGRVASQKNLGRLIEAVAACRAQGLDVRVDWVGRVDDPVEGAAVQRAVIDQGLAEAWTWQGEQGDVANRLRQCDALIAPSLWEGLPNVVCEALASGVPVLASTIADNARLVPDGTHGLLFDPRDVRAMGDAIGRFAALPAAERAAMGQRGRAFAERHLGLEACVSAYERVLSGGDA